MPVIFSTPTSHRVFMLDKDANMMLKGMKTSGNIPGALFPEAIPNALITLKERVQLDSNEEAKNAADESNSSDEKSDHVDINTKALPLIELMQRAIEQNEKLLWEEG